jgi:two-component system, LytTR family, response regulator
MFNSKSLVLVSKSLQLNLQEGAVNIPFSEIIYCRASSNYSIIYLNSGKKVWIAKTLKWLQDKLPATQFIRVHRSQLVNTVFINHTATSGQGLVCTLVNNTHCVISRRKRKQVCHILNN